MESVTNNVKRRSFGSDLAFCDWMRNCGELPSYSRDVGFVATDVDLFLHNYLVAIDGSGSRDIQTLMAVEVKTRFGEPNKSQLDTLAKMHFTSFQYRAVLFGSEYVRNFGVSVLQLSGTTPANSQKMLWGRFNQRELKWKEINFSELIDLFLCKRHPDSLDRNPLRRHHKTRELVATVKTELGFSIDELIRKKS